MSPTQAPDRVKENRFKLSDGHSQGSTSRLRRETEASETQTEIYVSTLVSEEGFLPADTGDGNREDAEQNITGQLPSPKDEDILVKAEENLDVQVNGMTPHEPAGVQDGGSENSVLNEEFMEEPTYDYEVAVEIPRVVMDPLPDDEVNTDDAESNLPGSGTADRYDVVPPTVESLTDDNAGKPVVDGVGVLGEKQEVTTVHFMEETTSGDGPTLYRAEVEQAVTTEKNQAIAVTEYLNEDVFVSGHETSLTNPLPHSSQEDAGGVNNLRLQPRAIGMGISQYEDGNYVVGIGEMTTTFYEESDNDDFYDDDSDITDPPSAGILTNDTTDIPQKDDTSSISTDAPDVYSTEATTTPVGRATSPVPSFIGRLLDGQTTTAAVQLPSLSPARVSEVHSTSTNMPTYSTDTSTALPTHSTQTSFTILASSAAGTAFAGFSSAASTTPSATLQTTETPTTPGSVDGEINTTSSSNTSESPTAAARTTTPVVVTDRSTSERSTVTTSASAAAAATSTVVAQSTRIPLTLRPQSVPATVISHTVATRTSESTGLTGHTPPATPPNSFLVTSTRPFGSSGNSSGLALTTDPDDQHGGGGEDDTFWPIVAALVIGVPSIIVFGIAITVIHKRRLASPARLRAASMYPSL